MNPLKLLFGGGLQAIDGILGRFLVNKDQAEANAHSEQMAMRDQVAAEWAAPERISPWNALVDGLNRLVRPLFTYGTVALFIWAVVDPIEFSKSMTALGLVPEALWIILGTIVVFWFGGRTLEGMKASPIDPKRVAATLQTIKQIDQLRPKAHPTPAQQADIDRHASETGGPISDEEFDHEMADTGKLLSLPAIEEWNRRRKDDR